MADSFQSKHFVHLYYSFAFKVHLLPSREKRLPFSPPFSQISPPKVGRILLLSQGKGGHVCSAHGQLIVSRNVFHLHVYNVNSAGVSTVPFTMPFPQGCNCLSGQSRHLFFFLFLMAFLLGQKWNGSASLFRKGLFCLSK